LIKSRRQILELFILIALVHASFSLIVWPHIKKNEKIYTEDRDKYSEIAKNILAGKGYSLDPGPHPTMKRMPLYPLFLAALYGVFGRSDIVLFIFQFLFVIACVIITMSIANRINKAAGLFSGAIVGLYPLVILYTPRHYSEVITLFLVTFSIWALIKYLENKQKFWFVLFSFSISLAWLSRSSLFLLLGAIFVVLMVDRAVKNKKFIFITGIIVFIITIAPWVIRNYRISGCFVPGSTWNSRAALHGILVMTDKDAENRLRLLDQAYSLHFDRKIQLKLGVIDSPKLEVAQSRYAYKLILDYLLKNKFKYVLSVWRSFYRILFLTSTKVMKLIVGSVNLFLLFLIIFGFSSNRDLVRKNKFLSYVFIVAFVVPFFYIFEFPVVRYVVPSVSAIAIFAGIGFVDLLKKIVGVKRFEKVMEKI